MINLVHYKNKLSISVNLQSLKIFANQSEASKEWEKQIKKNLILEGKKNYFG